MSENGSLSARLFASFRTILPSYFDLIAKILRLIARERGVKVPLGLERLITPSVDTRLAKLEDARRYLLESLEAVDELKRDAEQNKRDLERALAELQVTMADRDAAHEELRSIRTVMSADIAAFRNLAGVPQCHEGAGDRLRRRYHRLIGRDHHVGRGHQSCRVASDPENREGSHSTGRDAGKAELRDQLSSAI